MILKKIILFIVSHPLSNKRKINALLNFIYWQINQVINNKSKIIEWIDSSKLDIKKGNTGLTGNIYVGLAEYNEMGFLLHCLKNDDLFIDVGANAGAYSIISTKVIGAETLSFEPIPKAIEILKKQIILNNVSTKITIKEMSLGDQNTEVPFSKNFDTTNRIINKNEAKKIEYLIVKQSKLDDQVNIKKEFILKIDVEGYELNVLKGSINVLKNEKLLAVIIETNGSEKNYGIKEGEIYKFLKKYDLEPYNYDPKNRILIKIENKNQYNSNTIFVRDIKIVSERVREAKKFKIHTAGGVIL